MNPPDQKSQDDASHFVTWSAEDSASSDSVAVSSVSNPSMLEFVQLGAGCRLFDTRVTGGVFSPGESRDYQVTGQCGVPNHAKAVEISLSTIGGSPVTSSFARSGPGGIEPTVTVLQFYAGQGASVTTTIAFSNTGQIRLKSFGTAGFAGDVLGYWQAPLWGRVRADGTLLAGSGVVSITKSPTYLGDYYVYFDRPISPNCAATVTPEAPNIRIYGTNLISYYSFDARVYSSLEEADGDFAFTITCSR